MVLLIHSLEIILLLLVASLGYRVVKEYHSEYNVSTGQECDITQQVDIISNVKEDKIDGKSIVESYIDDFFIVESDDFTHPLSVFKQPDQLATEVQDSSMDKTAKPKIENTDRSISSKVIDAMMTEADLACAS